MFTKMVLEHLNIYLARKKGESLFYTVYKNEIIDLKLKKKKNERKKQLLEDKHWENLHDFGVPMPFKILR